MESRVEKYREYRKEIQSDAGEEVTAKSKTSEKVDIVREKNGHSESLSYDTVLGAHDIYSKNFNFNHDPYKGKTRRNIPYIVCSSLVLLALLSVTIFLALLTFGGIKL